MTVPTTPLADEGLGAELRALRILDEHGPQTCSLLGAALWGTGNRPCQAYARPAGRLLAALRRRGFVDRLAHKDDPRTWWELTHWGREHLGVGT